MDTYLFEAVSPAGNWGKFLVGVMAEEWTWRSRINPTAPVATALLPEPNDWGCHDAQCGDSTWDHDCPVTPLPLLGTIGWNRRALWVLDLQTCEGAAFTPGGSASADLMKHRIHVCPLFEPFLDWLYGQDTARLSTLGPLVEVRAPLQLGGYRRPGTATQRGDSAAHR